MIAWYVAVSALCALSFVVGWMLRGERAKTYAEPWKLALRNMPAEVGMAAVSTGSGVGDKLWGWNSSPAPGRVLVCSSSFDRLIGREPGTTVGLTFQEFTTGETLDEDVRLFDRVVRGESDGYAIEKAYERGDGTEIPVGLTVAVPGHQVGMRPPWALAFVVSREREKEARSQVADMRKALGRKPLSGGGMRLLLESLQG